MQQIEADGALEVKKPSHYERIVKPRKDKDPEYKEKLNEASRVCMLKAYHDNEERRKEKLRKLKEYHAAHKAERHQYYLDTKEKKKKALQEKKDELERNLALTDELNRKLADMIKTQMSLLKI